MKQFDFFLSYLHFNALDHRFCFVSLIWTRICRSSSLFLIFILIVPVCQTTNDFDEDRLNFSKELHNIFMVSKIKTFFDKSGGNKTKNPIKISTYFLRFLKIRVLLALHFSFLRDFQNRKDCKCN